LVLRVGLAICLGYDFTSKICGCVGFILFEFFEIQVAHGYYSNLEAQLRQEMFFGLNVISFQIGEHNIAVIVLGKASASNKPGTLDLKYGSSAIWLGCVPF
jgi:hypothetical protein